MSQECLVLNEWLLHDLCGDNGREKQEESYKFLVRLKEKCDRIAVLYNSPWAKKANGLIGQDNPLVRKVSKFLHRAILHDPQKCLFLYEHEIISITDEERNVVPQEDLYLVETYYSADADVLVTTDQKLLEIISSLQSIRIRVKHRNDFLAEFLSAG